VNESEISGIHKALQSKLTKIYSVPDMVHGFVHGKNIRTNAEPHLAKKVILKIDIKDFFESITKMHVENVFLDLGCSRQIAEYLAKLVTIDEKLVQGIVVSPLISNLAFAITDLRLSHYCNENNLTYTRYADDITISSEEIIPRISDISEILLDFGFQINNKKTAIMHRGRKQFVTGLTVFDNLYPRIPKNRKRNLRLKLYYFKKFEKNRNFENAQKIKGEIDYLNAIEPLLACRLNSEFGETLSAILNPQTHL
jgi:retron-type reverse transcriptase